MIEYGLIPRCRSLTWFAADKHLSDASVFVTLKANANGICVSYVYIRMYTRALEFQRTTGGAPVLSAVTFIFQIDTWLSIHRSPGPGNVLGVD